MWMPTTNLEWTVWNRKAGGRSITSSFQRRSSQKRSVCAVKYRPAACRPLSRLLLLFIPFSLASLAVLLWPHTALLFIYCIWYNYAVCFLLKVFYDMFHCHSLSWTTFGQQNYMKLPKVEQICFWLFFHKHLFCDVWAKLLNVCLRCEMWVFYDQTKTARR